MATNWEVDFGTPERTARALVALCEASGISIKRKSDGKPISEEEPLKWLHEEAIDD